MGRRWLVGHVSGRRAQDICRRNQFFSVAWTDSSTLRVDRQCCRLWERLYHFPKGRASVYLAEMAAQRPRLARRRSPQRVIESQGSRQVTRLVGLRRSLAKIPAAVPSPGAVPVLQRQHVRRRRADRCGFRVRRPPHDPPAGGHVRRGQTSGFPRPGAQSPLGGSDPERSRHQSHAGLGACWPLARHRGR